MSEGNYWNRATRRRVGRRDVIRGAGIGIAGIAGAALIGCGGDDATTPAAPGTPTNGAPPATPGDPQVMGAPGLPRAPGFPGPEFGQVPVNDKPRIMGGDMVVGYGARVLGGRAMDPDVSGFCGPAEYVNEGLAQPRPGWDESLEFDVLESFEWVSDTELVLKIRPNIKTHDRAPTNGRLVNAEDIAFTINRTAGVFDPEKARSHPRRGYYYGLDRAEAVDDVTVRVLHNRPNADFLMGWGDSRQIVSLVELEDWDFADMTTFPGFGAWIIEEDTDSVRAVLRAHPDYYREDSEGGRPSFDRLILRAEPDRSASIAAFITRETDHLAQVNPHEEPQIMASRPDALFYRSPMSTITHLNVNPMTVPAFQDQRVRQALQLVRDFQEISDPISAPGWQLSGPFHPLHDLAIKHAELVTMPGRNPDTKAQDIAEAQKLMTAAGYPGGAGISFGFMSSGATGRNFESGERGRNQLVRAFPQMQVELEPAPDVATFNRRLNEGDWTGMAHDFAQSPAIALNGMTYIHSTGGRNYANQEQLQAWGEWDWIDRSIESIAEELDPDRRQELVSSFEREWFEFGPPYLNTAVLMTNHAFQSNIGGVDLVAGTWTFFYTVLCYGELFRFFWRTE
jgi:ABC-type transport system substrate-binding protein